MANIPMPQKNVYPPIIIQEIPKKTEVRPKPKVSTPQATSSDPEDWNNSPFKKLNERAYKFRKTQEAMWNQSLKEFYAETQRIIDKGKKENKINKSYPDDAVGDNPSDNAAAAHA
jgi:hypothetical protein